MAHLSDVAHYAELTGRDGLPCRIWLNPVSGEFSSALQSGASLAGLRGLLTSGDLYVWQSVNLLHADFERESGVEGARVGLRSGTIQVNDETVAHPELFSWMFLDDA